MNNQIIQSDYDKRDYSETKPINLLKYALPLQCQNNQKVLVDSIYHAYHYTPFSYLGHISLLNQKRLNIAREIIAINPHSVHPVSNFA